MEETVTAGRRRARGRYGGRCARTVGLLLASTLVAPVAACAGGPSEEELREYAASPGAESARAAEERRARALIERLAAVEGLEHVRTRFTDSCAGAPERDSLFEDTWSPYALTCGMEAVAHFAVRDDVTDVLPRIRAAALAAWGPRDDQGRDMPYAAGTVTYALDYHRGRGRYPDGRPMPAPELRAPGLRIDWDRPDMPLRNLVAEPAPCPAAGSAVHHRCSTVPDAPTSLAEARDRYGTVLVLSVGGPPSSATDYFTVARRT